MIEKACKFGSDKALVGIISTGENSQSNRHLPGVIFLNAGLLHHVGPHRLHVDLSRELAFHGFTCLRFDLSGIGDSGLYKGGEAYEARAVKDIQDAMDLLLLEKGLDRFVLVGLCAGADNSHRVALADERVSGLVLIDGYGYRAGSFYVHFFLRRIFESFSLRKIGNFLRRRLSENSRREEIFTRRFPPREVFEEELSRLIARGLRLMFIYSGDAFRYFIYERQVEDSFTSIDFQDRLCVKLFKEADHTFTLREDRTKLMKAVSEWMQSNYGSSGFRVHQ